MAWMIRPSLPPGATFSGELVFNSTDIEVDEELNKYIDSGTFEVAPDYIIKNTGFEKKKYRTSNASTIYISLMLVGSLPFWLHEVLLRLAIAVNGTGMVLEYKDSIQSGTADVPVTYNCRWVNAGDFVSNNELLNGGSIDLVAYTIPSLEGNRPDGLPTGGEWDVMIETPASGTEWEMVIDDADADYVYYEAIE